MFTNRIAGHLTESSPATAPVATTLGIPAGFAVCQLAPAANSQAIQLIAQQQAYEKAILSAREDALRIVLGMLKPSVN